MKEAYLIEGMHSSSCEHVIQKEISKLHGISSVQVSLSDSSLTVDYDPGTVTIDEIKGAIENVGYKISDKKPGSDQRQHDPVG